MKNLTRTLLSHPAFGTFMEDMSRNQTFLRGPAPQHLNMPMAEPTMPQQQQQPQQPEIKQEQPEQQPQQSQQGQQQDPIHVNMAHMPDSSLDMSMLNLGANHWGSQNAGFNFQQPSVFAVFDVPQPSIEELKAMRTTSSSSDMVEREQPESAEPEQTIEPASVASSTSRHPSHSATTLSTNFSFAALYNQLDQALSTAHRIDHYDEDSDPQSSTPMPQWSCEWPMVA